MAKCDIGKVIIDGLKLCYTAKHTFLNELSEVKIGLTTKYGDFLLFRYHAKKYKCAFNVLYENTVVGQLEFGHYTEKELSSFVYFRFENEILYNKTMFDLALNFPCVLNMLFHHITYIDLAKDFKYDIVKRVRKIAKDKNTAIIVNRKTIDKTKDISNGMFIFPLNFSKLSNPTISVKQAKAMNDKSQGLTLCLYNKKKEIENKSHKFYINEFYGYPKSLHRLEVHQNNQEIKDFCKTNNIVQEISLLSNTQFLESMYYFHIQSLLRFTRKRKRLEWKDILQ